MTKNIDISIIVTCHSEGIILHKTLLSIYRSLESFEKNISYEILIHSDNPTKGTTDYLNNIPKYFRNVFIYKNAFGDPGLSRNFCIGKSRGKYIALIDGDDLMCKNWLPKAFFELESQEYGKFIAHSEMTIEFGASGSIVQKYSEIDKETDALLNVWSARWNAVIFAPSHILKDIGYPSNQPGYGYEDWLISCIFIDKNIHNIVIPDTVIFVRRKENDSIWFTQRTSMSVLPATPILSFSYIRSIGLPKNFIENKEENTILKKQILRERLKNKIINTPLEKYARNIVKLYRSMPQNQIPAWLMSEWKSIHAIERSIFPTNNISIYHSITPTHYRLGRIYKELIEQTQFNKYNYIIFVPWLIKGGADKFAINYVNNIAKISNKKCLVIATDANVSSVWQNKLGDSVDFMSFGEKAGNLPIEHKYRLLEQIIENSSANILHILNSALGYDFIISHASYIKGSSKKVIVTSFSQSTDNSGRVFGFSHTHVPKIYELADIITTDNQAISDMWQKDYGFNPNKILVHHQPVDKYDKNINLEKPKFNILWASRLAPEKIPSIVQDIGQLLLDNPNIHIDMYGDVDQGFSTSFLKKMPSNVSYKGPYDGFYSLPLEKYSVYLYTTMFDGMPNVILEAAAAGLPIISSRIGGIPEFIEDQKNGILINDNLAANSYAKAIEILEKDRKLAKELSKNAQNKINALYSSIGYFKQIEEMLKKIEGK